MAGGSWGHRPALDGVRSLAIYLVVLFHAGLTRFAGGFIGVDVFFVLSGFLVTNVILAEYGEHGRLRLGRFYARRVRRLLPAAVVCITSVSALSVLVEPKLARVPFIDDARASLLYAANWRFLGSATDYFAEDVNRSPFLHFWSLAIEEQFYVVYPVVLIGLLWLARRRRRPSTIAIGLGLLLGASLVAQLVIASSSELRAYYGTHTRLYQLLAGALLAVLWNAADRARADSVEQVPGSVVTAIRVGSPDGRSSRGERWAGPLVVLALAGVVLFATDVVDLSPSTRGIVATVITVALIVALEVRPRGVVGRLLSSAPITYLGRISYGTYLWHWPIIVLSKPVLDLSPGQLAIVAAVGATAMSALSSELIETPIRRRPWLDPYPWLVVAGGLSVSLACAVLLVGPVLSSSAKPVLPERSAVGSAELSPGDPLADVLAAVPSDLDLAATQPPSYDDSSCTQQDPDGCIIHQGSGPRVMLMGDSNAIVLVPVLTALAEEHDFTLSVLTKVGCPWQQGLSWVAQDQGLVDACTAARDGWYRTIVPALRPDLIITAHVPRDVGTRTDGSFYRSPRSDQDGMSIENVVAAATRASLDELTADGARVALLEPLPYPDFDPTACLSGASTVDACAWRAAIDPFPTESLYRDEARRRDDVVDIDVDRLACPYLPVCVGMIDGELVFRNQFHLGNSWFMDHRRELWAMLVDGGAFEGLGVGDR